MVYLYQNKETLPTFIAKHLLPLQLFTRIHSINRYRSNTYVKREDELSASIVGSKYRKYASIIPFLKQQNFSEVAIIGGENSNNIVGILQFLNEHNLTAKPFLLKQNQHNLRGNSLWLRLLCPENEIYWIERKDWTRVNDIAYAYCNRQTHKTFVLEEGGNHESALWGAMTLAIDILRNEQQNSLNFSDIFIDSGTGITSIAMILGFAVMQEHNRNFHITMIAGNESTYRNLLQKYTSYIENTLSTTIDTSKYNITFHTPPTAKSFGAVNTTVLNEIQLIARTTGMLVDPIYSAKHFLTAKNTVTQNSPSLLIFNGSSFGLAGFQEKIEQKIK
ncbi:hypothetical protein [Candidatus Uabimicrobium sp. HlEnr_7]|uniref:hypothetical protein n=1 Tax=Candidatus Uabimicrobium helgolandensis TaxID=3095367 RepID=UPI0035564687